MNATINGTSSEEEEEAVQVINQHLDQHHDDQHNDNDQHMVVMLFSRSSVTSLRTNLTCVTFTPMTPRSHRLGNG